MRLSVLVFAASLASAGVCAAQVRSPNPNVTIPAQQPHVQVAPATALDIQALRNENQALRQRVDALVQALNTYGLCERLRVQAEGQSGNSVAVGQPLLLACGGYGEEEHLRILEDIQ